MTITALRPGRPSVSHDAITHFKRGEEFSRRRTEEGLRNALEEYNTAVRLEPGYSLAWAGLADAYSSMSNFGIMDQQQALGLGREAAVRAVQLDSRSARAQGVLGYVTSLDFDRWRTAEPYFRAAINLDPADEDTRLWYGAYLGKLGRFDDAIAQLKSGLDQSPSSFVLNHQLAMEYFLSRRFTDLERQARDLVRLHPYDASSHLTLARALEWRGRYEEALESCSLAAKYSDSMSALCFRGSVEAAMGNLAEANRIAARVEQYWVGHSFETVLLVALWCRIGNYAKALACLEEGYRRRDNSILAAQVNPYLDPLREQPRYKSVIRSLGLTP